MASEPLGKQVEPDEKVVGERLLLQTRGLTKRFGDLVANDGIDFDLRAGEIHCVLGENGAGKSTLMNTIYGLHVPDEGEILVRGESAAIASPSDAIALRIGMVHQHFMLIPTLSVLENVLLGEVGMTQLPNRGEHASRLRRLASEYEFDADLDALVSTLSLGTRQQIEILKALYRDSEILILDEPTSVLSPIEVERLFAVLRRLAAEGVGIVIITHKMREVLEIADRITVLRGGRVVGRAQRGSTSEPELTGWMFGTSLDDELRLPDVARAGGVRSGDHLHLRDVRVLGDDGRVAVDGLSLHVEGGEVVGLAGVSGNGQRELAEAIAGVRPTSEGAISLGGRELTGLDPARMRELGVVYIPEERDAGLALGLSMHDNLVLADYRRPAYSVLGLLRRRALRQYALGLVERFKLVRDRLDRPVRPLSGGNQQRVVLARSLASRSAVLVAAQATQGLDLATTRYVHGLVRELRDEGVGVLYISTDLDELFEVADRIGVMFHGRLVGVVERTEFSRRTLGYMMTSGTAA